MKPVNAQLPRYAPDEHGAGGPSTAPGSGVAGWLTPMIVLAVIGAVMGNTLRRPLRGAWDGTDLAWTVVFAVLAGLLAIPYHRWRMHAERQGRDCLALIRGDTLFVFPDPDSEQRVPLLGVTKVVQGETGDNGTKIVTERATAMLDADFTLRLDAARTARLVEFVNACLPPAPQEPRP